DGRAVAEFDVGVADVYLHGTLLSEQTYSGGRLLSETAHRYQKCPVEIEAPATLPAIQFACEIQQRTTHWEGTTTPVVTQVDTTWDGFGNVIAQANQGVVSGCAMSCTRPGDAWGEACGGDCIGDESFEETQYVPRTMTHGAWIVHAPWR